MTPTAPNTTPNSAVILERLEMLRTDLAKLQATVECLTKSEDDFVLNYTRSHTILESHVQKVDDKASSAHQRIDALSVMVAELAKSISPIAYQSKLLTWIGGVVGISVIALIWAIITHQVSLSFP